MVMALALEQTLTLSSSFSSKNSIFSIPRNQLRISSFFPFHSYLNPPKHLRFATRFPKCSAMENYTNYSAVTYPKPSEIPWKKELSNSVTLIGTVGLPVELKHLPSGKDVAWTRLAVWKSSTETSWISLTFWDELAHIASQHVQKGNQIYVSGRLVADLVEADDGKQQTYYKKSPKYPDFKHKDTGEALWVEGRYNPPWVKSQLALLDMRMSSLDDQEVKMTNFVSNFDFPSY